MIGLLASPIFTVGMLILLTLLGVGGALLRLSRGDSLQRLMGCGQLIWLGVALVIVLVVWMTLANVRSRLMSNDLGPGIPPSSYTPIPWSTIPAFGTPANGGSISISP